MMKEVTVKELATAFEGVLTEVNPSDYYGFTFEMSKARIEYDEANGELSFTAGNYNLDGIGTVVIKEEHINSVEHDEETGEYVLSFTENVPDVVVSRFKTKEELEQEHAAKKQK